MGKHQLPAVGGAGIATPVAYVAPARETLAPRSSLSITNLTGPDTSLVVHFCAVLVCFLPCVVVVLVVLWQTTSSILPAGP